MNVTMQRISAMPSIRRQQGFTMIEVMVAVFIVLVGLLGLAKLEALVFSESGVSNARSIASLEASGLANAMHSNQAYWGNLRSGQSTPAAVTISGITVTVGGATVSYCALTSAGCTSGIRCTNSTCSTPAAMAYQDLANFAYALSQQLPGTGAKISCAGTPVVCTIATTWLEKTVALNSSLTAAKTGSDDSGGSKSAPVQQSFTLLVQP